MKKKRVSIFIDKEDKIAIQRLQIQYSYESGVKVNLPEVIMRAVYKALRSDTPFPIPRQRAKPDYPKLIREKLEKSDHLDEGFMSMEQIKEAIGELKASSQKIGSSLRGLGFLKKRKGTKTFWLARPKQWWTIQKAREF